MRRSPTVEIHNTTRKRGEIPRVQFEKIARATLGTHYTLSLVICGDTLARKMNKDYRKKGYAANVLSFPYEKNDGEIFLNVQAARREAKKFEVSLRARLALLFTHACLHLKGMRHGRRMDQAEQRVLRKSR